jgi:outer membrane protein OmpA-like peptidoglycan-associated protein
VLRDLRTSGRAQYSVRNFGESYPFTLDSAREIVRIDFPLPHNTVEAGLAKECRVEVPGLYFDFNRATINAQSRPALQAIADTLKRHQWSVAIEGHTDNVGFRTTTVSPLVAPRR